jgi:TonB family protein
MRFKAYLAFSCLICAISHAQPADDSFALDPKHPPTINEVEKCEEAVAEPAMPLWPKTALRAGTVGWVVVRYDLDGSGRAQNATVDISTPAQVFDQSALFSIKRSKFKAQISRTGCKILIVFSNGST